jgi:hypothetical protein
VKVYLEQLNNHSPLIGLDLHTIRGIIQEIHKLNKDVLQPLLHVVQAAGAPLAPATPQKQTGTSLRGKTPVKPTFQSGVGSTTGIGTPIISTIHKRKTKKSTISSTNACSQTQSISRHYEKSEILPNEEHEGQMSKAENVQKDDESIALTEQIKMLIDVYPDTAEEVSNALDTIIRTCPLPLDPPSASGFNDILTSPSHPWSQPNPIIDPPSASGFNDILTPPSHPWSQPNGHEIFPDFINYLEESELGKLVAGSLTYVAF